MSVYLYRLGRFAYRRKWFVLPAWLLLLVVLGGLASQLAKPMDNDFTMPNLPSERANSILDEHFPGFSKQFSFDAVTGTYVIAAPPGHRLTEPAYEQGIAALVKKLNDTKGIDHAEPISSPLADTRDLGCFGANRSDPAKCSAAPVNVLNKTRPDTVAVVDVKYTIASFGDITQAERDAAYALANVARQSGLQVELAGSIAQENAQPGGSAEMIGMAVAFVVMIIAFSALVAAFVPIITALVGLAAAMMLIQVGTAAITIPSFTTFLASMIGIALSIDYALFIVSRYKHELTVSATPEEAAGRAVGTAGTAVVFAGLTVVIALGGLSIVGVKFLTFMGLGGAIATVFAVLVALTLLPALLGAFGRFLFKPRLPFTAEASPERVTNGQRFARVIGRAPAVALALGILVLGLLAAPALKLNLGLPGEESQPVASTVRKAYDLRTEGFGEGSNGVLMVAVDLKDTPPADRDKALNELRATLTSYDDMDYVVGPQRSKDGAGAFFRAVPLSGPNNKHTQELVADVRDAESGLHNSYKVNYGVTGTTAVYADVSHVLLKSIVPYLSIVAAAALVLLTLAFRSLLLPLIASLGFLLSMAATFGATVLIFQEGAFGLISDPQPIVSFLPIMLIGLVFGLAMDYTVFTATRMREEYVHGKSPKEAMIAGYHHGARVVTAAAIIMISVFSAFILETDVTAKTMGFALAAGVLLDAFIVRMVVLPAVLALIGKWAWWLPKWLDRILPEVDIEGAKLRPSATAAQSKTESPVPV